MYTVKTYIPLNIDISDIYDWCQKVVGNNNVEVKTQIENAEQILFTFKYEIHRTAFILTYPEYIQDE